MFLDTRKHTLFGKARCESEVAQFHNAVCLCRAAHQEISVLHVTVDNAQAVDVAQRGQHANRNVFVPRMRHEIEPRAGDKTTRHVLLAALRAVNATWQSS